MFPLEVGQELEFILPASIDGRIIPKGTRARVGSILSEVPGIVEPRVTLVLHSDPLQTLTLERHVVTLHCRPV